MTDEKLLRAIGDQIKTKRKQLNLRQNEIESIATNHYEHFKISQPRISEIEHGRMHMENTSFLTSKELTVLGTVLKIDWQKLLFHQKQMQISIVKHIRKEYDVNRYPLLPDYVIK